MQVGRTGILYRDLENVDFEHRPEESERLMLSGLIRNKNASYLLGCDSLFNMSHLLHRLLS